MKVFVAGATGAMGKQLVPRLVAAGHEVVGMTRSESKQGALGSSARPRWSPTRSIADQVAEAVARRSPR